jgi:hypothetical protein
MFIISPNTNSYNGIKEHCRKNIVEMIISGNTIEGCRVIIEAWNSIPEITLLRIFKKKPVVQARPWAGNPD